MSALLMKILRGSGQGISGKINSPGDAVQSSEFWMDDKTSWTSQKSPRDYKAG